MEQRVYVFSISLDPEEDVRDPELFVGLAKFIDDDLGERERDEFFTKTIPRIVERATALKATKPPHGLYFSLQQQGDYFCYCRNTRVLRYTTSKTSVRSRGLRRVQLRVRIFVTGKRIFLNLSKTNDQDSSDSR